MITFGNLSAAFLFVLLPLISLLWVWKGERIKRAVGKWISPNLQRQVVAISSSRKMVMELLFWNGIMALLILALMDPRGNPRYLTTQKHVEKSSGDILFLIDASASMSVTDTRTKQSRFEIAKEIAQQTIEQLSGNTIAAFAFTSELLPLSPPTLDLLFVHMMINQLEVNEGGSVGTSLVDALEQLIPTLSQDSASKTVVVLSDGENTEPESLEDVYALIDKMVQLKTVVEVVGVGSPGGGVIPGMVYEGKAVTSVPDLVLLQQIAARGRGNYLNALENSSLAIATELTRDIRAENHSSVTVGEHSYSEVLYTHYRAYPVALALLLLVIYRLSPLFLSFVFLCCVQTHLSAESPFLHAKHQLEAGDLPQAVREWSSLAMTNKSLWDQSVSLYNLAYAQILQKKWQDAINTLDLIPLSNDTPEYLTYHVLWNKAWANFQLKNAPEMTLEMINKSKKAYCDWLMAIGAKDCSPPPRYENFTRLVLSTPYTKPAKQTFNYDPDPIKILKQLISLLEQDNILEVLAAASSFEFRSLELQKERFFKECQFHPWNEVYPPFFEGVTLLKRDAQDQVLQAKALVKFREALEKLQQPPEKFKGSCWGGSNPNLLQQLQSMNNSDKQPKKQQKVKGGGGKPW